MKAKRSCLLAPIVMAVLLSGHAFANEELMKDFVSALEGDDKMLIIKSAKEIRPHYAQLYMLFGDFRQFGDPR